MVNKVSSKVLENKAQPLGKYPHIKRVGDLLFVSGTSSRRPDNTHAGAVKNDDGTFTLDIAKQTEALIQNLAAILKEENASLEDIVDVTTFLVDMKDFKEYNTVYAEFFTFNGPTRTTVAVHQLPHENLLIEMKIIAYKPLNK